MNKATNVGLACKLAILLSAILISLIASSYMTMSTGRQAQAAGALISLNYRAIGHVEGIWKSLLAQESEVRGYLLSANEALLQTYQANLQSYAQDLGQARALMSYDPAQVQRLDELDALSGKWRKEIAEREIALMRNEATRDEARQIMVTGRGKATMAIVQAKVGELIANERMALQRNDSLGEKYVDVAGVTATMGVGVVLLVSVAGVAFLVWSVSRPLGAITRQMTELARGDATIEVPYQNRRDEVGAISKAVQVFKDSLIRTRQLEAETAQARLAAEEQRGIAMREMADRFDQAVGGIITRVTESAGILQSTAVTLANTANEGAAQSVTVAAAAEEAAVNVNTVAAAAEELNASVSEIGRQVQGSSELARQATIEGDQTARLVQDLSTAADRIGNVVLIISTIAAQTNLLALNATIEAARAGEAGRGFAVVAAEVKELANQTSRATAEISSQIDRIQAVTDQAVTAINGIGSRIGEIGGMSDTIAAAVQQQESATQEIVRNVSQAAAGTGEVTSNIAGVAGAAEQTGASAGQVLGAASDLSAQSEHLSREVARFLASVRAA